jgi:hypothetical protein
MSDWQTGPPTVTFRDDLAQKELQILACENTTHFPLRSRWIAAAGNDCSNLAGAVFRFHKRNLMFRPNQQKLQKGDFHARCVLHH